MRSLSYINVAPAPSLHFRPHLHRRRPPPRAPPRLSSILRLFVPPILTLEQDEAKTPCREGSSSSYLRVRPAPTTKRLRLSSYPSSQLRQQHSGSVPPQQVHIDDPPANGPVPGRRPVNYMKMKSPEFAELRRLNQFDLPRSATDHRFHTLVQQDVYDTVYSPKKKFADHKWADWEYLRQQRRYEGLFEMCMASGVDRIMALRQDYNEELIRQFYATIYIPSDRSGISWMSDGQRCNASAEEFAACLGLPTDRSYRVHSKKPLVAGQYDKYYDREFDDCVHGKVHGLLPVPCVINRLIRATIMPRSGNSDHIRGHAWNLVDTIHSGRQFDVMDLILVEMNLSKGGVNKRVYYAPYIMRLILHATGQQQILFPVVHNRYRPEGDFQKDLGHRRKRTPEQTEQEEIEQAEEPEESHSRTTQQFSEIMTFLRGFESTLSMRLSQVDSSLTEFGTRLSSVEQAQCDLRAHLQSATTSSVTPVTNPDL